MESFSEVDVSALRWLRTSDDPEVFELRAGDGLMGRLTRARHEGTLWHAETGEGRWSIKRVGFLHPRVTLRRAEAPGDVARLDIHWRRTSLEVVGGRSFRFERAGLSVPAWQYLTSAGVRVMHIEPVREGRALVGGTVSVTVTPEPVPELPLLLLVGWYYIVQEWFEDQAVAAGEAFLDASS